jgi:plasmid replication initiation protein
MSSRRPADAQFDLFVPYVSDLPLRDQRETMERPFFSLAKRKRVKPILYQSPNGEVFVNVLPHQDFGMATIWDADILIWAASVLNERRKRGDNDIPRTLSFHPYDLLKTVGRETGGREYRLLREALARLQSTTIVTNIRVKRGKKHRQFSWIEGWTDLADEEGKQSKGMTLTLSDWFYEGLLIEGSLLSIDPVYFQISGGRERWLYRVARKHAGGAGEGGFAIPLPTLFEKSGAEGTYRRFKFEMHAVVRRNDIPGYRLSIELGGGEPVLRMVRAEFAESDSAAKPARKRPPESAPPSAGTASTRLPLFGPRALSADLIERICRDFPRWDVYALQAEFDAWIAEAPSRTPKDYEAAFYGFVRQHHNRNHG